MATNTLTLQLNTPSSPSSPSSSFTFTSMIRRFIPTIIEGSLPFATYMLVHAIFHTSDVVALSIGALIPAVLSLVRFVRSRTIDIIGVLILLGILTSIAAAILGGDARLLLIRESFFGAIFGLTLLVSLLLKRPLLFYLARHFRAGNDARLVAEFNARWQQPSFRQSLRILTSIWGLGMLGEFALRVALVYTLSVPMVLAISAIVFPAIYVALGMYTFWYMRQSIKKVQ